MFGDVRVFEVWRAQNGHSLTNGNRLDQCTVLVNEGRIEHDHVTARLWA